MSTGNAAAFTAYIVDPANVVATVYVQTDGLGHAVQARSLNSASTTAAISGEVSGTGPAIEGRVLGLGRAYLGVITNPGNASPALEVTTAGTGPGVKALITNAANSNVAVYGETNGIGDTAMDALNTGGGRAMRARIVNPTNSSTALLASTIGSGTGVDAVSTSGIGVSAQGGRAPLLLAPKTGTGAPVSGEHRLGEVVVDSEGSMFHCKVTDTPGTWLRVGYNAIDPTRIVDTLSGGRAGFARRHSSRRW